MSAPMAAMSELRESALDKSGGVPLYQRVREQLKAELDRGLWKPGDMLPTEIELGQQFGVSAGTVKQAILSLVREGLVIRRPGKGTFVARLDGSKSFARFFRFREGRSGELLDPTIRVVDVRILRPAPPEIAANLRIGPRGSALFLRRMLIQGDTPICVYNSYLPYKLVAGLEDKRLDEERLYLAIERHFDIHVVSAEEILRASIARGDEAKLLKLGEGAPVILIERTAFTHNSTVIEWRQTTGRSDRFVYRIRLP